MAFYQGLLGRKVGNRVKVNASIVKNRPVLRIDQQLQLLDPFSTKDVKEAMFQIDKI